MAASRNKKKGRGDLDKELEQYMLAAAKARAAAASVPTLPTESVPETESSSVKEENDEINLVGSDYLDESMNGGVNLDLSSESAMLE